MRLSIITINWNNATGLEKTMQSVATQSFKEFEYIVVDGASTDGSIEVVKLFESKIAHLKWVSEPDSGIYNAMNKGIRMASGDYIQILNSGDCLAKEDVIERMLSALENAGVPSILYGNMVKCFPDGYSMVDKSFAGQEITMLGMYKGTLNHDPAYIRRDLFDKYGFYDESLKIVSDWEFFFEQWLKGCTYKQLNFFISNYYLGGFSFQHKELLEQERNEVISRLLPQRLIDDFVYEAESKTKLEEKIEIAMTLPPIQRDLKILRNAFKWLMSDIF
jgi:glycosyltransferase involved in cell wall biosynthesis